MARQHSLALGALAFQLLARRPDYTEFCVGLVSCALIVTFWASPSNGLHQPRRFSVPSVELNADLPSSRLAPFAYSGQTVCFFFVSLFSLVPRQL